MTERPAGRAWPTVVELAEAVRAGERRAVEVLDDALAAIEAANEPLNAFVHVDPDLARAAEVNPGAMTRLLDKLEARGLIVRVADPSDRRALDIRLTEAGTIIWQDINQCGMRVRELAMQGMTDAERQQLSELLVRVRDNLSNPTPRP